MILFKLTRDKIIIENSYIILNTLLQITLDSFGKVVEVSTVCTTNDEVRIEEASDYIKSLPQRISREISRSEFDELIDLYKNNIKEFQRYRI